MLETAQRASEGWYPDPSGQLLLRRWDGAGWTSETRGGPAGVLTPQPQTPLISAAVPEPGWGAVAFAVHSALMSAQPVTVRIATPSHGEVAVHAQQHTYTWAEEPATLPELPAATQIMFERTDEARAQQGRNLDGLLWRISRTAFASRLAPWLQEDDLYRLQRWPNLSTINPELEDMRQAAMLANGMFTVEELAGFSDRALPPTVTLINALSLMNTLKVAAPRSTTMVAPAAQVPRPAQTVRPAKKPGLFQRLRDRLGL